MKEGKERLGTHRVTIQKKGEETENHMTVKFDPL
jgi:hypothetical protein